ncbi:MAG TPA: FABP family protein [Actinomycetota bacterium]|nr:FABP family protein [Actinomycetota bacterium]
MRIHPDIAPLEFLFGTWTGTGKGEYPTISDFSYGEEIRFAPGPGKPFVTYAQRTWRAGTADPLHAETGYLRGLGSDRLELVIAQPTGVVEVHSGVLDGRSLVFEGLAYTTPSARQVSATRRQIVVDGDRLEYRLAMEAVGQPLLHHLAAVLTRAAD